MILFLAACSRLWRRNLGRPPRFAAGAAEVTFAGSVAADG